MVLGLRAKVPSTGVNLRYSVRLEYKCLLCVFHRVLLFLVSSSLIYLFVGPGNLGEVANTVVAAETAQYRARTGVSKLLYSM
jgi:hypothetical protein